MPKRQNTAEKLALAAERDEIAARKKREKAKILALTELAQKRPDLTGAVVEYFEKLIKKHPVVDEDFVKGEQKEEEEEKVHGIPAGFTEAGRREAATVDEKKLL
eukprot:5974887-Amphidinium_carterae.1